MTWPFLSEGDIGENVWHIVYDVAVPERRGYWRKRMTHRIRRGRSWAKGILKKKDNTTYMARPFLSEGDIEEKGQHNIYGAAVPERRGYWGKTRKH